MIFLSYKNVFLRKKNLASHVQHLILAGMDKGEVFPESVAPKIDVLLFVKNY